MSGNYTDVREMSGNSRKVMEMSGKKSCHGKLCDFYNFLNSVAVDGTGFYDVIILKSLSLNMNLTV